MNLNGMKTLGLAAALLVALLAPRAIADGESLGYNGEYFGISLDTAADVEHSATKVTKRTPLGTRTDLYTHASAAIDVASTVRVPGLAKEDLVGFDLAASATVNPFVRSASHSRGFQIGGDHLDPNVDDHCQSKTFLSYTYVIPTGVPYLTVTIEGAVGAYIEFFMCSRAFSKTSAKAYIWGDAETNVWISIMGAATYINAVRCELEVSVRALDVRFANPYASTSNTGNDWAAVSEESLDDEPNCLKVMGGSVSGGIGYMFNSVSIEVWIRVKINTVIRGWKTLWSDCIYDYSTPTQTFKLDGV